MPLLKQAPLSIVQEFFTEHLKDLWGIIRAKPNGPSRSKAVNEQQVELMELECAYELLTLLFTRCDLQALKVALGGIKHLDIMKQANLHVKKCGRQGSRSLPVSYVSFHCAAYKLLSAAVILTQSDCKYFDLICFKEKPLEDQFLWENVVDTTTSWQFTISNNAQVVDAAMLKDIDARVNALHKKSKREGRKLLASQFIAGSSLSSQIEGGISSFAILDEEEKQGGKEEEEDEEEEARGRGRRGKREVDDEDKARKKKKKGKEGWNSDEEEDGDGEGADLTAGECVDLDCVNSSPVMPSLLRLIDHMYRLFGRQWARSTSMPTFMQAMWDQMTSIKEEGGQGGSSTHVNIQWTIAKVVVNRWLIFERYAQHWFAPLVKLCLRENNGGKGFHYFLRDICYLFLQWTTFLPPPEHKDLASRFIAHLFKVADDFGAPEEKDQRRYRQKTNLRLIKLIVEKWKEVVWVDKKVILTKLQAKVSSSFSNDPGTVSRYVGLQLLGICLANDFPLYDSYYDKEIGEEALLECLLDNVVSSRKELYMPASELFGMVWRAGGDSGESRRSRDRYKKAFAAAYKKLYDRKEFERFLTVLNQVGLAVQDQGHHFFDRKLMNLVFNIPTNLQGDSLTKALQLIYWAARTPISAVDDDGIRLLDKISPIIRKVLSERNSDTQEMLLLVIYQDLDNMTKADLESLLPKLVEVCAKHRSQKCRALYYKILIAIHNRHPAIKEAELKEESFSDPLMKKLRAALLRGLADESPTLCATIFDFWDNEDRISDNLTERLQKCLRDLYQHETEGDWLRYCTFLLLNPLKRSTDYDRSFSDTPLAECKFQAMEINSQFTGGSQAVFTPLFSVSSQGVLREKKEQQRAGGPKPVDMPPQMQLRKTQSDAFSLTQTVHDLLEEVQIIFFFLFHGVRFISFVLLVYFLTSY